MNVNELEPMYRTRNSLRQRKETNQNYTKAKNSSESFAEVLKREMRKRCE